MKLSFVNSYPARQEDGTAKKGSNNRNLMMFKYIVSGTEAELAEYKTAQGGDLPKGDKDNHYREDEKGRPLYFTSRPCGKTGVLSISQKGKVFVDTSNLDMAASLIENYGSAGLIMAKELLGTKAGFTNEMIESANEKLD